MKRRVRAIILLLALCLLLGGVPALADPLWSEEYYRAADTSKQLSAEERNSLDEDCIAFMRQHQLDLALVAVTAEDREDSTLRALGEDFYDDCGFGYGEGRDGFLLIWDTDNRDVLILCFGAAQGRIPQAYLDSAAETILPYEETYGVYGVLYGGMRYLANYLEGSSDVPAPPASPSAERVGEDARMPAWYPADTKDFSFYHDENAPRVVDAADIFTDAEEQAMEARIAELRRTLQKDVVVYTDVSDYGLGHDVLAADFYDFNGYGYGGEREGLCLFVCMDPADRGWWTCATGPDTRQLYSEYNANLIDDALYEYMAAGSYGAGVADWIENVRTLYVKGAPFVPDWYPEQGAAIERFHDPDAPRVTDDAGLLSASELAALSARAAEIAQKYGVDIAIHTAALAENLSRDEYTKLYYEHMGYGFGENYDGILLSVFKRPGYTSGNRILASGAGADKLSAVNQERLQDQFREAVNEGSYYKALSRWLDQVEHMERTGRVPRGAAYWRMIALVSLLVGLVFGGVSLGIARMKMAAPVLKRDADSYIVSDASRIRDLGRQYLYTTSSQRRIPRQTRSGGSGGGSSFSGSYSGSSGASHSGSGRKF